MKMSSAIWFAIAAGIVTVVAVVRFFWTKTDARGLDVGAVSDQWIAEHRADPAMASAAESVAVPHFLPILCARLTAAAA